LKNFARAHRLIAKGGKGLSQPTYRKEVNMPIILVLYGVILALAVWQDEHGTHGEHQ
jgi:hypothetical protein